MPRSKRYIQLPVRYWKPPAQEFITIRPRNCCIAMGLILIPIILLKFHRIFWMMRFVMLPDESFYAIEIWNVRFFWKDAMCTMYATLTILIISIHTTVKDVLIPVKMPSRLPKIVDWTRHIDAVQTGGFAADVPKEIGDRVIIRQMMLNCRKHIGFSCTDAESLLDIIDMAAIVVGSHEALKENSYIFHLQEPISPLVHDENSIKEVMICAEHNIPIVYYPMPMGGATAPATAAGLLAQNHAESLTGLVIHQLTKPGAPFVYGGAASVMDMKTMRFCYGAPELHLFCTALADIAHHFEIPFWGTAGCVETDEVNEQAAAELGISLLMAGLGGAQLVHDTGLMDQATLVCPEIMLLSDEIMDMVKAILRGIHINEETLALDVINSVGPGGNFLGTDHTYKHFRNFWSPNLFERLTGEKNENKISFSKKLNEKAKNIIETHEVPPLSEDKIKAIKDLEKKWLK